MDEKEREVESFDLEDILKEFGEPHAEPAEQQAAEPAEQQAAEPADNVQIWQNKIEAQKITDESDLAATVRLDSVVKAVHKQQQGSMEQTVQFAPVEETVRFTPVGGDAALPEEEPPVTVAREDRVEPYSETWEPEYEQPIHDYVPQEPIVFRPKSRLRELKKKLIEGPEKRYYELLEQGTGKLQAAIFLNLIIVLLVAASAVMYAFGFVPEDRLRLMIFGQFFALLVSALLGSYQLIEGVQDLFQKRFSLNTLLIFSLVASCADAIICLNALRVPCCGVFSLHVSMSLWSAYQKRNTEMGQMDTMRKAVRLDSLVSVPDYMDDKQGFLRSEGRVEDFMDHYDVTPEPERKISLYALIALLASVVIGIVAGVLQSWPVGIQVFAAALLVAVPAVSYIATSRPMALLERRLHRLGTVICGWDAVREMSKPSVFPLRNADIFPAGTTKMNGVKFFGNRNPDEVVAYAAALVTTDGSGLATLFSQLLDSRNGIHYEATDLRNYENGGIGGIVNDEAVLAGSLNFMQEMGVELPTGTKVNQAVYVAIGGELCGVFAVSFAKFKLSAAGLTTLCAYRGLHPVLLTGDFMLTDEFLKRRFGVNTKRIIFPGRKLRDELTAKQAPEEGKALAMMTNNELAGMAFAVTGARALSSACRVGVLINMIGGALGLTVMLALAIVGAQSLLTPMNLLLFELLWLIPGVLVTEWTRSV